MASDSGVEHRWSQAAVAVRRFADRLLFQPAPELDPPVVGHWCQVEPDRVIQQPQPEVIADVNEAADALGARRRETGSEILLGLIGGVGDPDRDAASPCGRSGNLDGVGRHRLINTQDHTLQ